MQEDRCMAKIKFFMLDILQILLRIPNWITYIFEFAFAWIAVYFSIQYIIKKHLSNVSIFQGGELLLSFFVTILFKGVTSFFLT
jgi:hypothetical protein